jgi:hypothetical protein
MENQWRLSGDILVEGQDRARRGDGEQTGPDPGGSGNRSGSRAPAPAADTNPIWRPYAAAGIRYRL